MVGEAWIVAGAFVVGAAFGSFLNVCILRLPLDESIIRPGSRCPRCSASIAWYDNLPLVSWFMLRGRCRSCGEGISVQYPSVEALVGILWAVAVWYYGFTLDALAGALLGTILLGIAITDARHYLIPDEYTVGGLVIGLLLSLRGGWEGALTAVIGAALGFTLLLGVGWVGEKALRKEAMGGGDIKMMAMVGAFVGWKGVLLTIFGGALLGSLVFLPLSLKSKRLVPFGVFLAAAAAITFVAGEQILRWYLGFVRGA